MRSHIVFRNLERGRTLRFLLTSMSLIALLSPYAARAECSERQILKMSEKGRSTASIAKRCDMEPDEVMSVLEDAVDGPRGGSGETGTIDTGGGGSAPPGNGFPRGQPVMQCGCWGNAMPGAQFPNATCQARFAIALPCQAMCPTGGLMWYAVCG